MIVYTKKEIITNIGLAMKIKFNRSALQEALGLVTSVVPSRTPKPILQCLRILANEDGVQVCGTDLEVGINCQVAQAEVEKPGDVVLPADRVNAIIRESVDDVIEFESIDSTIHIRGVDSHFTIYGHDLNQFPQIPGEEDSCEFKITLGALQGGIEHSLFAAAKESTRYAINGVLWDFSLNALTMVGTDGRRLAKFLVEFDGAISPNMVGQRIIVPAKTMSLLDKLGASEDEIVSVRFIDNQIVLTCSGVVISSNLVEGNFPKYDDIIPTENDKVITLNTDAVLSAVRRAALLISEDSKGIKMTLGKGVMVFSSRAPETGDAQIDMAIDYDGEPVEIGFNPQFLTDVLRVIKTDELTLKLGQADRPGLISAGEDFIYIVMPVNLG